MDLGLYILDEGGEPQPEPDTRTWAQWMEARDSGRIILQDHLPRHARVSTIFLGLDHHHLGVGGGEPHAPILWETMVFGGPFDGAQQRYTSKLDALAGHAQLVRLHEAYASCPRRTKKALGKSPYTLRPGERRRVRRVLARTFR